MGSNGVVKQEKKSWFHVRDSARVNLCGKPGSNVSIEALAGAWGTNPRYRDEVCPACLNVVEDGEHPEVRRGR